MFERLVAEMASIKTRKFFLTDGPASVELTQAVESSELLLPPSYKRFVLQFGNAKLYRRHSYYYVTVFAGPRGMESEHGETLIQIGRTSTSTVFFKESLLAADAESPVFEWRNKQGLRETADNFEQWLRLKCAAARRRYKQKEWQRIIAGPPPFTPSEQAIVEARRDYRWQVVGIADNGDLRFQVYNGSKLTLPFLSVGIRGIQGTLDGGVWLPVSALLPGQTAVVEKDCYKDLISPDQIEAFELPDPEPEDHDLYWEFR